MDLIYTNKKMIDQGVLTAYAFDLSFGEEENDFEITVDADYPLQTGAIVYIEGTEYGGMIDGVKASTAGQSVTYTGRTWHGILNSKVIEPERDHLVLSGEVNGVLLVLINRLGLGGLFTVSDEYSDIDISEYKFPRFCMGYDGIRGMLKANGLKLKVEYANRGVRLSAERIVDYSDETIDDYSAQLAVDVTDNKVNHLICLGKGNLYNRTVIHLYVDQLGRYGSVKYYSGVDEITAVYDNSSAEDIDELREGGIERLNELRGIDKAEISISESMERQYDIGDIVGATERKAGITVTKPVAQKIVRINNGAVSVEYQAKG